ncbi:hypothetical protein EEL32_25420 [Brevibacillus laterosporus]|nr:hypothetical protein [Brevibacillus laterosporus]TPG73999.1 hypothetical protein EEL32_25420 [Brevibacillus laterosporus]
MKTDEYQIANLEAEIKRIAEQQEQTKAEIKQMSAQLQSANSKLSEVLAYDARLTDCIQLRRIAVTKLKLDGELIH